jgi:hypothetical protein
LTHDIPNRDVRYGTRKMQVTVRIISDSLNANESRFELSVCCKIFLLLLLLKSRQPEESWIIISHGEADCSVAAQALISGLKDAGGIVRVEEIINAL